MTLANMGNLFLGIALLFSFYSFVMSFAGSKSNIPFLKKTSLLSFHLNSLLIILASALLFFAFVTDRFDIEYVYAYSSREQSLIYKLAGFYAGREGSLLLWALLLAIFSSFYIRRLKKREDNDLYPILFVLSFVSLFFNILLYFVSTPFTGVEYLPPNGKGLNPLLENFYMMIHPPALYIGFIMFTVPFAEAIVALFKSDESGDWIYKTRNWIVVSWLFLGLGNLLGSYWAYIELGWGGYWAWDPVENASLIPWLISTALVHSIVAQRRFSIFKTWNYSLIFATFISTIVATFLTRSGVVSSVHAFAKSEVSDYFLAFIILILLVSYGLLIFRSFKMEKGKTVEFLTSKESSFAFLNIIFLFSAVAVLLGTLMPVISELFFGKKITLEAPYYNKIFSVIGLVLLFGIGVCPLLKWGRKLLIIFDFKTIGYLVCLFTCGLISLVLGERDAMSTLSYSLSSGAIFTTVVLIVRWARRNSFKSILNYGGMIAHIGMVLMIFGMTGTASKTEIEKNFKKGEEYNFREYRLVSGGFQYSKDERKEMVFSLFDIFKGDKKIDTILPGKFYYQPSIEGDEPQVSTEMGIHTSLKEDLIVILLAFDIDKDFVQVKIVRNPLIVWLWMGGTLLFIGTLVSILGFKGRREAAGYEN